MSSQIVVVFVKTACLLGPCFLFLYPLDQSFIAGNRQDNALGNLVLQRERIAALLIVASCPHVVA